MKRVLVTGACGQVGSRVVRQLLERDYDVRGLVLPGDVARSRLDGLDIEVMEGNLLDMSVAARAMDGVDGVIHTANLVAPLPGMSESEFFDNNVLATFNLSAPRAIPSDEGAKLVAEAVGREVLEWRVPVRWVFALDSTKARTMIGYQPRWGIEEMLASA